MISPLKVAPSHRPPVANKLPTNRELQFAADCGLSLSQVDPWGAAEIQRAAVAFNYVKGGPMVRPGVNQEDIPTRLRALNKWYERVAKEGRTQFYFMAGKVLFRWKNSFGFSIYVTST